MIGPQYSAHCCCLTSHGKPWNQSSRRSLKIVRKTGKQAMSCVHLYLSCTMGKWACMDNLKTQARRTSLTTCVFNCTQYSAHISVLLAHPNAGLYYDHQRKWWPSCSRCLDGQDTAALLPGFYYVSNVRSIWCKCGSYAWPFREAREEAGANREAPAFCGPVFSWLGGCDDRRELIGKLLP